MVRQHDAFTASLRSENGILPTVSNHSTTMIREESHRDTLNPCTVVNESAYREKA